MHADTLSPAAPLDAAVEAECTHAVRVVFQPIVDLITGQSIGYEVLARPRNGGNGAESLFEAARRRGETWELESACRTEALRRIAELGVEVPSGLYFLNVSPEVIVDPRLSQTLGVNVLRRLGIDPARIVIEITERSGIEDHEHFQNVMGEYVRQGLRFAVDDFGSGHSSLLALITCVPHFVKLDMEIVRDLHQDSYRRHLVRSLVAFASSVDSRLVAEGVEKKEELEALLRLGVRYAQGYYLGRPAPAPSAMQPSIASEVQEILRASPANLGDLDETIEPLVAPSKMYRTGTVTVEMLEAEFAHSPGLDHVVIVDEKGRPKGLVTREDLCSKLAGRYAYALRQKKPADRIAKKSPLLVSEGAQVTTLASRAMDREGPELYDPVLVTDSTGVLLGAVTMKALIKRSVELQVRNAQGANPLTGLPGNRAIERWIVGSADVPSLTVVYADLDRFKEYNDRYGFLMGDELIRLTGRVLGRFLGAGDGACLGHVGGDDFVAVVQDDIPESVLALACQQFDEEKRALLDPEDLELGYIVARTRRGDVEQVPLVTLSLAVLCRERIDGSVHPALLSQLAASLKKKVKALTSELGRSAYVLEQRRTTHRPP